MTTSLRQRLVFHGAVAILVGLLCGFAVVPEAEPARLWHRIHESLILLGTMLLGISSAVPVLALDARQQRALGWSLLAALYGFMGSFLVEALTGAQPFEPSRSPLPMLGFIGNAMGIVGSLFAAALVVIGARAARTAAAAEAA